MPTTIIDRRNEQRNDPYAANKDRLDRRYRDLYKEKIRDLVNKGSIKDFAKDAHIPIPKRDLRQPIFNSGNSGAHDIVMPGNKEFHVGDIIERPGGGGKGSGGPEASEDGEGEDDYLYAPLTQDQVLDIIFKDCDLPNLLKESTEGAQKFETRPAGLTLKGSPSRMDLSQTFMNQANEKAVLNNSALKGKINALLTQIEIFSQYHDEPSPNMEGLKKPEQMQILADFASRIRPAVEGLLTEDQRKLVEAYDAKIKTYDKQLGRRVSFREEQERFVVDEVYPLPINKAVMFCLMDVSGSMSEEMKMTAKSFYGLLHLFLTRKYQQVDIVFIRHHTQAKEVDEHTFFYDKESGGTIVSSVLTEMDSIRKSRYNDGSWNIYGAQTSDGDNWSGDNIRCTNLLEGMISEIQGYFYVEISNANWSRDNSDLWPDYARFAAKHPDKFFMAKASGPTDYIPAFRKLFARKEGAVAALTPSP